VGKKIVVNHVRGYLPGRIVGLLMNVHTTHRPIYLATHGLSEYNQQGRLGGDSSLTPVGQKYARRLGRFMKREVKRSDPLAVWTSTLRRTHETASTLGRKFMQWRALDEIDAGVCDGFTFDEIEAKYPHLHEERAQDLLRWRYPRGESYLDVVGRLEAVFVGIERQMCPVLIISHRAVLRAIACYFGNKSPEEVPSFPITQHSVLKLTPTAYGCDAELFELYKLPEQQPVHPLDR